MLKFNGILMAYLMACVILLLAPAAQAQSLVTGVTKQFCDLRGGRFTYTGTAGSSVANVGECYIPPSFSRGSIPSVGTGGGGGGGLGSAAAALGAAGNLLGGLAVFADALNDFQNSRQAQSGPSGEFAPSNADALSLVKYTIVPLTAPDPALAALANGDDSVHSYAMLGVLGDPAVVIQIEKACAGSTQTAQLACVLGQMDAALLKRLPGAREKCDRPGVDDLTRSICLTRMQMEATGIQPGECVGECSLRLRWSVLLNRDPR